MLEAMDIEEEFLLNLWKNKQIDYIIDGKNVLDLFRSVDGGLLYMADDDIIYRMELQDVQVLIKKLLE
jgi:hypothetical protein